jgi:hypothetical protein
MIILNENKLRCSTLAMIGEDYEMEYDMNNFDEESYGEYLASIVKRFNFDVEDFKERFVEIIKDKLKIELKLV